jgi:pimeloyl-ACP methyl ester carboxylesterase
MPVSNEIYYSRSNGGQSVDCPPVVLIHGAGSSHLCWPAEMRRVPGWTVLAVDLPGHGHSGGIGQHTINAYAQMVIEFLESVGIYQSILVGHSMGGAIALEVAILQPDRVAGLGLISCGAYMGEQADLIEALSNEVTIPAAFHWLQRHLFSESAKSYVIEATMKVLEQSRSGVFYADWLSCTRFDRRQDISLCTAPAWVAVGLEDQVAPLAYSYFLAHHLPKASLQVIAGAGHMVSMEQPQALSQGLRTFLTQMIEILALRGE